MKIGMIGLGRMGLNMAKRLLRHDQEVAAFNRTPEKTRELAQHGAMAAFSLEELVAALPFPRAIWMMLPAGELVDQYLEKLLPLLSPGDVVVDGANSDYRDSRRRAKALADQRLIFMDVGVSGGIWGLRNGYCLMIGGSKQGFVHLEQVFEALAPKGGYRLCGPSGAGHFVKMVHNGIEYGMMQAYAEGFALMEASPYTEDFDLQKIAQLWNQGSVVRSWLLELVEKSLRQDPRLAELQPYVEDSGEGRWMVREALDNAVSMPVITQSLMERFRSRDKNSFGDRMLAAMRREFGGHAVQTRKE
ncbi:MAG TPA: decarboxylating 6-phosphogluconate dehydrogenase [Desulfonatronum sp.]|nr:decarboxylating 6-phosphogluconate dehydrogenase [Desulfonatronum sp.]